MKLLSVIVLVLPYVFSSNLLEGLNSSSWKSLLQLKKFTEELDKRGQYLTRNLASRKVDIDKLSLIVSTRSNLNGTKISLSNASQIVGLTSFNINKKTSIYIYGWLEKSDEKGSVLVRDAVLNVSDRNVILLDWNDCANSINYVTSWGCVEGIGNYLGEALGNISEIHNYSLSNVTLVGHSLGAHISGYAGKYLNGSLGVIVGLDPAGPLFFKGQPNCRLNATDAQYVHAIHTCAGLLGVNYNVARADFWPNEGKSSQNGCGLDLFGECSHVRSYKYYSESVTFNDFYGRKCDSYKDYEKGNCDSNQQVKMGGLDIDTSGEGNHYLTTNNESPYGKGKTLT